MRGSGEKAEIVRRPCLTDADITAETAPIGEIDEAVSRCLGNYDGWSRCGRGKGFFFLRPHAQCVSSGVRGGCAPVESSAGIGFAACASKHYFVIGTKAAFNLKLQLEVQAEFKFKFLPVAGGRRRGVPTPGPGHASVPSGLPP